MRAVTTFHPPSSVVGSVKCNLTPEQEYLVVAKVNRLEVFSLQPEGLNFECGLDIWGRVTSFKSIPVNDTGRSNLLVLTDHPEPKLILLAYGTTEAGESTLVDKAHLDLHDHYARPTEFVHDFFLDPTGVVTVVCCYTGKLKVVQIDEGEKLQGIDISIPELYILALTFLHTESDVYALGIIHYDHQQRIQLLARDLDVSSADLSSAPSPLLPKTFLTSSILPMTDTPPKLVAIPPYTSPEETETTRAGSHLGGVLIFGGRKVLFYEHATEERQEVNKGKQKRADKRLKSTDEKEVLKAKEKEKERELKKVKPRTSVKWPWSEVTAYAPLDDQGRRFLLGDAFGRLAMLAFDDGPSLLLIPIGETSPPTSLTYLSSQVLFVGSHFGESQLVQIHPTPISDTSSDTLTIPAGIATVAPASIFAKDKGKERDVDYDMNIRADSVAREKELDKARRDGKIVATKGTHVEVLEQFQNIAPIVDAVLADTEGSGQTQIVTCSGGQNTGALKVIRTGADFQEQAVIHGVENVTNVWPVRTRYEDTIDTHIVASTLDETFAFIIDSETSITRLDPSADGLIATSPTLSVTNIPRRVTTNNGGRVASSYVDSSLVVQITREKVHLVEYNPSLGLFSPVGKGWDPPKDWPEIIAADANASQFVVGLSGGRLALLNLSEAAQLQELKHRDFFDSESHCSLEICAISCASFDSKKKYANNIAVSFWGSNTVAILSLESAQTYLTTLYETSPMPTLPRSLLLVNFGVGQTKKEVDYHPHLLAGLADGTVVAFSFKDKELKDKKVFALGTAPVTLSTCNVDGRTSVFATGSRASLLFWDKQRLQQSPVMVKDVVAGISLNASVYPKCIMLATSSALVIGNVQGIDKMQIRTIPLGLDNPRRVAYHPDLKVLAVACRRLAPPRVGDFEASLSSLKLLDDTNFAQLSSFACEPDEEISAVLALPGGGNHTSPSLCVGTVQIQAEEKEPSRGRILLFSCDTYEAAGYPPSPTLKLLAQVPVNGCIYQLVNVNGLVAAAVNTSVMLFLIGPASNGSGSMTLYKFADWNHNYFVTSLAVSGKTLVVGDAISSVSMLEVADRRLTSVARDYSPIWPVSVGSIGEKGVIGASSDCNLFTFALQHTTNRRAVLERDGSYHLGEVVNKFLADGVTSVDPSTDPVFTPKHLFFTSSGRIGVILDINDEVALHLTALQRNMAKSLIGPGETHHSKWRAPANRRGHSDAEPAFGFLDGDFVEQFLTLPNASKFLEGELEVERVTLEPAQVEDILEKLQSLH